MNYESFLISKEMTSKNYGIHVDMKSINPILFDFQKSIVQWACKKGKSAVFADCGLGKTFIQLEWARLISDTSLIIAPLCVAKQTIMEAKKIGIVVNFVRSSDEITNGINITNYEMVEHFTDNVDAIVLDESSILKSISGKTKKKLFEIFHGVKSKLCCTATPCPNDISEIGNHAEFLNIMTYPEMLASFFVNKSDKGMGWTMKPHAKDAFYKWLATWAMCLTNPSDLGFDGSEFQLPPISINHIPIGIDFRPDDALFFDGLKGIQDRIKIRKFTTDNRVTKVHELIQRSNGDQWICWCGLNGEAEKLQKLLGSQSVNLQGSDSIEQKEKTIEMFLSGEKKILITKAKIAGFGLNFQNASHMAFVGMNDSYENYYQCIRRSWRYGQKNPVDVNIVLTDLEDEIFNNVINKEKKAKELSTELIKNIEEFEKMEIGTLTKECAPVEIEKYEGHAWTLYHGDCVDVAKTLNTNSIDFSVYSPPFMSLYTYSASSRDMGNSRGADEFYAHYAFLIQELLRITKEGRNTAVHVSQIPAMLVRDGYIGLKDFRGDVVREYQKQGWIYHGEIVIQKNPQCQAVRTKCKSLLFAQLKRDSSWLRPGLADYILLFRKPGENKVPIIPKDISNEDWIKFAHPIWTDIKESNTLAKSEARSEDDEKHICPLQLDVIERCIRLWSNPEELVFSPFTGIGSEGYQSILFGRKFIGAELKKEYVDVAIKNLKYAEEKKSSALLF